MESLKKKRSVGRPKIKKEIHSTCLYFDAEIYKKAVSAALKEGISLTRYIENLVLMQVKEKVV